MDKFNALDQSLVGILTSDGVQCCKSGFTVGEHDVVDLGCDEADLK